PVRERVRKTVQVFLEAHRSTMLPYLTAQGASRPPEPMILPAQAEDRARPSEAAAAPFQFPIENGSPAKHYTDGRDHQTRVTPPQPSMRIDGIPSADPAAYSAHDRAPSLGEPLETGNGKPHGAVIATGAAAVPGRAAIINRLLETVRDRTGYPIETLGMDLDLEADLGIDSI